MPRPKDDAQTRREQYQMYRRGWSAGATTKQMVRVSRPDLQAEYDLGYTDGHNALNEYMRATSVRLGHQPSILRTARAPGPASGGCLCGHAEWCGICSSFGGVNG